MSDCIFWLTGGWPRVSQFYYQIKTIKKNFPKLPDTRKTAYINFKYLMNNYSYICTKFIYLY